MRPSSLHATTRLCIDHKVARECRRKNRLPRFAARRRRRPKAVTGYLSNPLQGWSDGRGATPMFQACRVAAVACTRVLLPHK